MERRRGSVSEYFQVSFFGGDERPIFCAPSRRLEDIRTLYPDALAVIEISRDAFMRLCERLERHA